MENSKKETKEQSWKSKKNVEVYSSTTNGKEIKGNKERKENRGETSSTALVLA